MQWMTTISNWILGVAWFALSLLSAYRTVTLTSDVRRGQRRPRNILAGLLVGVVLLFWNVVWLICALVILRGVGLFIGAIVPEDDEKLAVAYVLGSAYFVIPILWGISELMIALLLSDRPLANKSLERSRER